MSSRSKESTVRFSISIMAWVMTPSSSWAFSENSSPLSSISCAARRMFMAWSPMRSKSPMACRSSAASLLSAWDRSLLLSFTRNVPRVSS